HQYHPKCRLNLNTFRFRSLLPEIDPYELDLVCSPCLHRLTVRYVTVDCGYSGDYNKQAVMESVTIAPNLKEVKLQSCSPLLTTSNRRRRTYPKTDRWK